MFNGLFSWAKVLLFFIAATIARAQFTSGIDGVVKDPGGAVVVGAEVVVCR